MLKSVVRAPVGWLHTESRCHPLPSEVCRVKNLHRSRPSPICSSCPESRREEVKVRPPPPTCSSFPEPLLPRRANILIASPLLPRRAKILARVSSPSSTRPRAAQEPSAVDCSAPTRAKVPRCTVPELLIPLGAAEATNCSYCPRAAPRSQGALSLSCSSLSEPRQGPSTTDCSFPEPHTRIPRILGMAEAKFREELKSMVVSIKRSRTCIEITNNPEIIYFIGSILLAEPQFCYVVVDGDMVDDGFSYEATLPDGSVVPLVVDQFIVVEKGAFATFYIDRSAVNYNVNMINSVHFGDQEVSMFANVRVADFDKRQNIFFPGARVNALGGSIESTWQFTSPFDAPHICSLYACK